MLLLLSLLGAGAFAGALGAGDGEDDATPDDNNSKDNASNARARAGGDFIRGTAGADTLEGDGDDTIRARAGADTLTLTDSATGYGETGRDRITLSDRSTGYGGFADDVLIAADNSTAYGGNGADRLEGTGNSTLHGNAGNDVLTWRSAENDDGANALLRGGGGDDRLTAFSLGGETIRVAGNAGNDFLDIRRNAQGFGGTGNDTLFSANGGTLTGGSGSDLFFVSALSNSFSGGPSDTVTITDFDKTRDRLRIDLNGPPSEIAFTDDGTDTTLSILWEKEDPSGFETGPINSTIVIKGVTGLTQDDVTFSRGTAFSSASGFFDNPPPPMNGTYDDVRFGNDMADRITLSGNQPLVLAGDGADTVTGADFERLGFVMLGDGDDSFTDSTGRAFVYGGAGNDTYISDANAPGQRGTPLGAVDAFFGGDGDDRATITASGPGTTDPDAEGFYTLQMGAGNDTVIVDAAATQDVFIQDGDGDDTIRAGMGSTVLSGDGNDQIIFGVDADHVTAGRDPAFIRNLDATDRLILEIDSALTGELTAVDVPYDSSTEEGPFTELRIGDVTVVVIAKPGFQLTDPRLTVIREAAIT
ncbi:MAG: hypothetical protein C0427_11110 [Rhodobacter sp.]|nr:hypothetical protein [Rhodobacter sp.]